MTNRIGMRLLTALLATAVLSSAAVEVRAARFKSPSPAAKAQLASSTVKPTASPMIGEPDANGGGGPLPPKTGPYPTGMQTPSGFASWLRAAAAQFWSQIKTTLRLP